jgi:hypothetical protein
MCLHLVAMCLCGILIFLSYVWSYGGDFQLKLGKIHSWIGLQPPFEKFLLYNFDWALATHQTRLGSSPPSYNISYVNHLLLYIMLGFHSAASWQHLVQASMKRK